jgi:calcineurin-like phosphoesterase family protein
MSSRWFISDLHFFHSNIFRYQENRRRFLNVQEMNHHMIAKWNKSISKRDTVYIVGDFSFGTKEETTAIVKQLNGLQKILILGNHDRWRKYTIQDWIDIGFTDVKDEDLIKLSNAEQVLLKHYPYAESTLTKLWKLITFKKEYKRWYHPLFPVDRGLWHIHGHHHGGPKIQGRQINVNVDSWDFKPVSESEIIKMINDAKKLGILNKIKLTYNKYKFKIKNGWI